MISNSDFTVVIQGPITQGTNRTIQSAHEFYPGAKVVVSTCSPFEVEVVGADEVVSVSDPGGFRYNTGPNAGTNNVNRQIVSTLAGLKAVKTPYVMKLRSDFVLTGCGALTYLGRFPAFDPAFRVFRERIIGFYSPNPYQSPRPYHPSDQCFLGRTEDLIDLFDVPMMSAAEAVWRDGPFKANRYAPEQHIFISYLRKKTKVVPCDSIYDVTPENCEETDRYFAANFLIMGFPEWDLISTGEHLQIEFNPRGFVECYTFVDWQSLYKKYADPSHDAPFRDPERERLAVYCKIFERTQPLVNVISAFFRPKKTRNIKRRRLRRKILLWIYERVGLIDTNISYMNYLQRPLRSAGTIAKEK